MMVGSFLLSSLVCYWPPHNSFKGYRKGTSIQKRIDSIEISRASSALDHGVSPEEMMTLFRGYKQIVIVKFS